jgi:hypothetical protein
MADQADFVNLGTVQIVNGSQGFSFSNLVEGTVIPTENGGDPFALDFHSWDLDQGALSTTGKGKSSINDAIFSNTTLLLQNIFLSGLSLYQKHLLDGLRRRMVVLFVHR